MDFRILLTEINETTTSTGGIRLRPTVVLFESGVLALVAQSPAGPELDEGYVFSLDGEHDSLVCWSAVYRQTRLVGITPSQRANSQLAVPLLLGDRTLAYCTSSGTK